MARTIRTALAALAIVVAAAGCTGRTAPPNGAPGAPAVAPITATPGEGASGSLAAPTGPVQPPGQTWVTATVEQPPQVSSPYASGAAPGFCSPCHGANTAMSAVATDDSRLVAVGSIFPNSRSMAWTSADGRNWTLQEGLPAKVGTLATGVALGDGRIVVVGEDGGRAASWVGDGASGWREFLAPSEAGTDARMTAIVARPGGGFAAVGYEERPAGPVGVAWTSPDGSLWRASPSGTAFVGGRPLGLAVGLGGELVAVGSVTGRGTEQAAAWTSRDGIGWSAASVGPTAGASTMHGVAAGGPGYVAVGSSDGGLRAAVWTSTDGLAWNRAPDQPSFSNYGQRIAMASVASGAHLLVAVGGRDSVGNGSPVVWTSPDGVTWSRVPDPASFSGGEMTAVVPYGAGHVAVGSLGWPDNTHAVAWSSPG